MARGWKVARIVAMILLGAAAAALSNRLASTERKLAWIGAYPRALEVGPPEAPPTATPGVPTPAQPAPAAAPALEPTGAVSVEATPGPTPPAAPDADVLKSFPPHPDKASVEIAPADVERLYRAKALFLDARRSSVFAEGHIAGARSFPVWESDIDARVKALYEEGLDQRAPIVIYCSGGNCEDSHMLAEKLYMVGFDNLLVYKDGFPDWQNRGLPVNKGATP